MPRSTTLTGAIECLPVVSQPCSFEPNPAFNPTLQAYIQDNNLAYNVPGFGTIAPNGKIPNRAALNAADPNQAWPAAPACDCNYPDNGKYSDGSTNGAYRSPYAPIGEYTYSGGPNLNTRNRVSGDFNGDGLRNMNDIRGLVTAWYDAGVQHDPQLRDLSGAAREFVGRQSGHP